MGKLVLFCLTLALMVASCGPATTTTKTSSVDSTVKTPQPKYVVGQYVWIDGVTKAYLYKANASSCGCGGNSDADGIGDYYDVTYCSNDGEHHLSFRENRLFASPDTFYHKIVIPQQLYDQIAAEHDSLFNMMITTKNRLQEVENENVINNRWLARFESANAPLKDHSKITNATINGK